MDLGNIITLVVFAISYLIIFIYQKKKIENLKTDVEKLKDISGQMERFMNMFDLDKVEKYVAMSEKLAKMEAKTTIQQIESDAKENFDFMLKEYTVLLEVVIEIIFKMPYLPIIENSLNEMREVQTKRSLLQALHKVRMTLESQGIDKRGWVAHFVIGLNLWRFMEEEKRHPPSQQK
jgi:hypothetical protein